MQNIYPLIFLLLGLATPLCSQAKTVNLLLATPDQLSTLKHSKGYLLIDIDAEGTTPSFIFKKLSARQRYLRGKQSSAKQLTTYIITAENKASGFYLLPLPKGLYQITTVNAPFFNLPYRVNTGYTRQWRFYIAPGKINYIGKLTIARARSTSYVNVRLLNRLASDKTRIDNQLAHLLDAMPLVSGMGFRDDFLQSLLARD